MKYFFFRKRKLLKRDLFSQRSSPKLIKAKQKLTKSENTSQNCTIDSELDVFYLCGAAGWKYATNCNFSYMASRRLCPIQTSPVRKSRERKIKRPWWTASLLSDRRKQKILFRSEKSKFIFKFSRLSKFKNFNLHRDWFSLTNENNTTLVKLEYIPGHCISCSVVIGEQQIVKNVCIVNL